MMVKNTLMSRCVTMCHSRTGLLTPHCDLLCVWECQSYFSGLNQFVCGLLPRWVLPSGVWKRVDLTIIFVSWNMQIMLCDASTGMNHSSFLRNKGIFFLPFILWAMKAELLLMDIYEICSLLNSSPEQWLSDHSLATVTRNSRPVKLWIYDYEVL